MKVHVKCVDCGTINTVNHEELSAWIRSVVRAYVTPSVN